MASLTPSISISIASSAKSSLKEWKPTGPPTTNLARYADGGRSSPGLTSRKDGLRSRSSISRRNSRSLRDTPLLGVRPRIQPRLTTNLFSKMKFEVLLFNYQTNEKDHEAPLTSTFLSLLFIAGVGVIVALYSGETLRCSVQQNQVGCQTMSSVSDCDNLLLVSCSTACGGTPY